MPRRPARNPHRISDGTLRWFLEEDMGPGLVDVTTDPTLGDAYSLDEGVAHVVSRDPCVASGLELAARLFQLPVPEAVGCIPPAGVIAEPHVRDGQEVPADTRLLTLLGNASVILRVERTALNLLGRMSGIATATRRAQHAVAAVSDTCRVAATRKTTPGFRAFEKLAVEHGGGDPHRFGLDDAAMVKDNHRDAGGLEEVLRRFRERYPVGTDEISWLEVEVESLTDAEIAVAHSADWILIDNKDPATFASMAQAIRAMDPDVRLEASGGITPETAPLYAPHADRVSMGCLTQSVDVIDIGLDWDTDEDAAPA